MNKEFAIEVLTEIQGTSRNYVREYGISLAKEAYRYLQRLYNNAKIKDDSHRELLQKTYSLIF